MPSDWAIFRGRISNDTNLKSEAALKTLVLDAFMSDLFITPAGRWSDYKATSALSDIIFSAERDGIYGRTQYAKSKAVAEDGTIEWEPIEIL